MWTDKFEFRGRHLPTGSRTYIAGILNVTPDSFSDGSQFFSKDKAIGRAIQMLENGADLIDIGGESTRPGAEAVPAGEELGRIIPVIEGLKKKCPTAIVSVDTYKSEVADTALKAGADIINDVSGLQNSHDMPEIVAKHNAGLVIMHMRGSPETMQSLTDYGDLVGEICGFLLSSARTAIEKGVHRKSIIIDPGIGFAKDFNQNLEILRNIEKIRECGFPVMIGTSRKSFIGKILNGREASGRVLGTAGTVAWLSMHRIDFVRVHDVMEMADVIRVIEAIKMPHPKKLL